MGTIGTIFTSPESAYWATSARPPHRAEWHSVDSAYGSTLARSSGVVRKMDNGVQPLSTLAQSGDMGSSFAEKCTSIGRSRRECLLGNPFRRFDQCASPSTCSWGKKSRAELEAIGRSRGGLTTKIHVRCDGQGKLITFVLTPGQQHDITVAEQLLEQGAIRRPSVGRPRLRPKRIAGDKGYASKDFRTFLRKHGIRITIPRKKNERRRGPFDKEAYRQRNHVERLMNRLKQFRRIATRYEKRAVNFAAMVTIAATVLWTKFAYTP